VTGRRHGGRRCGHVRSVPRLIFRSSRSRDGTRRNHTHAQLLGHRVGRQAERSPHALAKLGILKQSQELGTSHARRIVLPLLWPRHLGPPGRKRLIGRASGPVSPRAACRRGHRRELVLLGHELVTQAGVGVLVIEKCRLVGAAQIIRVHGPRRPAPLLRAAGGGAQRGAPSPQLDSRAGDMRYRRAYRKRRRNAAGGANRGAC
jgi:hypothetical protein